MPLVIPFQNLLYYQLTFGQTLHAGVISHFREEEIDLEKWPETVNEVLGIMALILALRRLRKKEYPEFEVNVTWDI